LKRLLLPTGRFHPKKIKQLARMVKTVDLF
jgi:hypothetical protein